MNEFKMDKTFTSYKVTHKTPENINAINKAVADDPQS